ncbi:MAG: hypothetical protein IJ064_05820 [Bacteroidaceae bacterium]|nr:hypothetical protein [Bacteroidaceae bacterium]
MPKVKIELSEYNALRDASKETESLKKQLADEKKRHAQEIHELADGGMIAVMVESPFGNLFGGKPAVREVVNLDKVRPQIEEAIINKAVSEANGKPIKELAEAKTRISDLENEVERLKNRSLWDRIKNK